MPMMASKPRNISSSPTNLSPSRIAIRNSAANRGSSGGSSNVSKKGPSSPVTTSSAAGRTPQTRRKELALPQQNSPIGSPKSNNNVKKNSLTSRKNSLNGSCGRPTISSTNRRQRNARHSATSSPTVKTAAAETAVKLREETKFDGLWDVKTIENGLVRIPTQCLEELITKESIEKFYEVEDKPVASGLFATVRKCVHRETGITYAAKFCSRVRCGVDCSMEILHEIAMLSVCTDSNKIVHLKDVFQNKHEIILVLEYAPGGDFQSVLDEDMVPFEEDVQGFLRQILEALDFIHDRNIAHLDIKPQNIVLMGQFPNCEIKLCDLEVARVIKEDEDIREIIGTPDYVAPEILSMDPITLAADIWSLGVVAYVLLTGFSPFGGDTDQETLRNISTAVLDFPPELFEGVSDLAKEFISLCLVRDSTKRPTVKECLAHPWLAPDDEPPSPSPLMLKIPTPELSEPIHKPDHHGHGSSGGGSMGPISTRRSCQTCRDKITERKRYLSKSREAIFEKVAQSNLKKSLSKSRERLCDMRLTLSKSRDNLGGDVTNKVMSRQQDKLYGFKNLSKSQEVISAALGGVPMKRMINGAVSDISHALKQPPAGSELPSPSMDFIFVPGSGILVPQSELLKINSGSLQILPISESGRSTPASQASVATVQDIPVSQAEVIVSSANMVVVSAPHTTGPTATNLVETPLIEVSEEEDDNSSNDKSSSTTTLSNGERASSVPKDIKESQNYELKKTKKLKSPLELDLLARKAETNSVGVQVNLIQAAALSPSPPIMSAKLAQPSPALARKLANLAAEPEEINLERHLLRNNKSNYESKTLPRRKSNNDVTKLLKQSSVEEKPAPLRRGYTHDAMLGLDKSNKAPWMDELNKIRTLKPIRITELIGTFDKPQGSEDIAALKQQRRGSLQIHLDDITGQLATQPLSDQELKEAALLKSQRRKSTPSNVLLASSLSHQIENILNLTNSESEETEKVDQEPEVPEEVKKKQLLAEQQQARKSEIKRQNREKNWDYFEIDHPKAISDNKLQQLKAKYLRRRTEGQLAIKEEAPEDLDSNGVTAKNAEKSFVKSKSVPINLGQQLMEIDAEKQRKISTDSGEESADSSRRSSRSSVYRRRSSHLSDFLDQRHKINEPTLSEDEDKKRRRLSVEIEVSTPTNPAAGPIANGANDDGFISLPHTPTDLGSLLDPRLKVATTTSSVSSTASTCGNDDGIFTSSEETLTAANNVMKLECCDHDSRPSSAAAASRPSPANNGHRRQSLMMIRPSSS